MKIWLLDNGSIVIEHTQLMWNVPGPQVRIPSYAVLVEHDDGRLGMKTGGGIYDYEPEQIDQLRGKRAAKLVAVRKALEA